MEAAEGNRYLVWYWWSVPISFIPLCQVEGLTACRLYLPSQGYILSPLSHFSN